MCKRYLLMNGCLKVTTTFSFLNFLFSQWFLIQFSLSPSGLMCLFSRHIPITILVLSGDFSYSVVFHASSIYFTLNTKVIKTCIFIAFHYGISCQCESRLYNTSHFCLWTSLQSSDSCCVSSPEDTDGLCCCPTTCNRNLRRWMSYL